MHSMWVWSINHDLTTSIRLNHTLNSLKSNPTWHKSNICVRVDPYAHPQHIKVINTLHTYDLDVGCIPWGLEPQPRHYYINQAQPCPIFPKINPHLHKHNNVRVEPYAHPPHFKVM